jgi:hypothetical protein
MRTIMLLLLLSVAGFCFSQTPVLFEVSTVRPAALKVNDFEKAIKTHVAKFHSKKDPMNVFEILSGTQAGNFFYVQPHTSWKELDVPRADLIQHDMDYDATVQPKIEWNGSVDYYRYVDSLSHPLDGNFTKYVFNFYYPKPGKLDELVAEIRRGVLVNNKNNSPANYQTYIKQLAGINPLVVIVTAFKDGFAQLDPEYMAPNSKKFKDTYIEMNGHEMWDKRMAFLPANMDKVETELVKFRVDLSTKN